jgi:MYXO-CTERM domain-containing protein
MAHTVIVSSLLFVRIRASYCTFPVDADRDLADATRMLRTVGVSAAFGLTACLAASGCTDGLDLSSLTSEVNIDAFVMPMMLTTEERAAIVHRYDHLDPGDEVPRGLLEDAMLFFDMNNAVIPKQDYFVVMDMSLFSGMDRFWLVDTTTGVVEPHKVAHGDGSDPDHDGYATMFSNVEGSHKTSLGFYLGGEVYNGTHPHSMRLDGLNRDGSPNNLANSNARQRLIVMHEASYVSDSNTNKQGRSNGCPALDPSINVEVVDRIRDGGLLYIAISPLHPPVGRAPDMPPDDMPPDDMPPDDMPPDADAGCSAGGGGAGALLGLALLGLRRRRR